MNNPSKLHFQVVCMDTKGYIQHYQNFKWNEAESMHRYLEHSWTDGNVNKVEITRWNDKGERV